MATFYIELDSCDRSPGCPAARSCPQGALKPVPGAARIGANGYFIDEDLCTSCGICYRTCRGGAVKRR